MLTGSGGGGGGGSPNNSYISTLPDLSSGLLDAQVVVILPIGQKMEKHVKDSDPDEDSESENDEELLVKLRQPKVQSNQEPAPPQNLGELGEKWAFEWLQKQEWVKPGSLVWLNENGEAHEDHDFECVSLKSPGRNHIEVKTRWCRFKRTAASARQQERVINPDDDYMLMVVGFFENMFQSEPKPPLVRLLPNAKWEDKKLNCKLCQKSHIWSIKWQKKSGIARVLNRQKWPWYCRGCFIKMKIRKEVKMKAMEAEKIGEKVCIDCKKVWIYTEVEYEFIKQHDFKAPRRCIQCRKMKRKEKVKKNEEIPQFKQKNCHVIDKNETKVINLF
jgi:hypothetical protein